jgi:protein transport protein SEC20
VKAPTDEAGVVTLANEATAGLRRTRAMMAEELEKGQKTLVAMAESRSQLKKTGDEYGGPVYTLNSVAHIA